MPEPIHIGITGTRYGGTEYQLLKCAKILSNKFIPGSEFHHGDCVGIDQQVARIARKIGSVIVCHPPIKRNVSSLKRGNQLKTLLVLKI